MEFVPASDKALAKLFSAYNGCMWKGGKLKLEKAKEHYLSRLRREWTEDSELAIKLASKTADADEITHTPTKFKADQDIEEMQLRVYFPKLRKIKPLPLKGTGKHKYSFQRVEIPPLPINFCDCEEHSGPPISAKRNDTNDIEQETVVVNEEELRIMKSVLNELLEKDNSSSKVSNEAKFTEEIKRPVTSGDNLQAVDYGESQVSDNDDDDDDVVINVVGRSSNRANPFEDWRQKTTANQDSLYIEMESITGNRERKHPKDKKRKASVSENETNDNHASKRMVKIDNQSSNSVPKATQLSSDVATVRNKPAWKNLVTEKGSASFQISDILTGLNPEGPKPKNVAPCSNKKESDDEQTKKTKELENLSDDQSNKTAESESHDETNEIKELETASVVNKPNKSSESEDKSAARGAAWLHKLSWRELVGDTSSKSFNLSEIISGGTFEKQELPQFESNDFSNSNFLAGDTSKPHGRAEEALLEKQEDADMDGGERKVEEKEDGKRASIPKSILVTNSRGLGGDIVISETCPFMRNAASMKEWAKTKAALSGSLKKKEKGKRNETEED